MVSVTDPKLLIKILQVTFTGGPLKFGLILASYPDVLPINLSKKSEGDRVCEGDFPDLESCSLQKVVLKWFVSKKNANKVVKIFTSCRFIPPAFCDDLEISQKRFQRDAGKK